MGPPGKDPPDHTIRRARRKDRSVRKELKTMQTHQIILAVGLASCLPLSAIPEGRCARGGDVFPSASGALVIEIAGAEAGVSISELSLGDVLRAFEGVAEHALFMNEETRDRVDSVAVGLSRSLTVASEEVYSFVSGLLYEHDFTMAEIRDTSPKLLGIQDARGAGGGFGGPQATVVEEQHLGTFAHYPALSITTTVAFDGFDVRGGVNALRVMVPDPNRLRIVAVGHSFVASGCARDVANIVEVLRSIEAATGALLTGGNEPGSVGASAEK